MSVQSHMISMNQIDRPLKDVMDEQWTGKRDIILVHYLVVVIGRQFLCLFVYEYSNEESIQTVHHCLNTNHTALLHTPPFEISEPSWFFIWYFFQDG